MQGYKQHKIRGRKPQDNPIIIKNIILKNKEKIIREGQLRPPSDRIWQEIKEKYNVIKTTKALYSFVSCNQWNLKYELGLLKRNINGKNENEDLYPEPEVEEEGEDDASEEELDNTDFMQKEQPSSSFQIHIPMENWNASFVVSGLSFYYCILFGKMPLLCCSYSFFCTFTFSYSFKF